MNSIQRVRQSLAESIQIKKAVLDYQYDLIAEIANELLRVLKDGGKIILFGNGGSAADAQHLAAELVGRFQRERRALPAIALTTNVSILTAIGNDYGYDKVFVRQIDALVSEKDVVIGISTSGNSPNVLLAMQAAREKEACCIGFSGKKGHQLAELCHYCLLVPSENVARIQEVHITVGHILCAIVEDALVGYNFSD